MAETYHCISIRQPWAWLVIHGGKDIENRDWASSYRGPLAIHAAKGMTKDEYEDAVAFVAKIAPSVVIPPPNQLVRGAVIGIVDMDGCTSQRTSPWFMGFYGHIYRNPRAIEPVPVRGQLGFFPVSLEVKRD